MKIFQSTCSTKKKFYSHLFINIYTSMSAYSPSPYLHILFDLKHVTKIISKSYQSVSTVSSPPSAVLPLWLIGSNYHRTFIYFLFTFILHVTSIKLYSYNSGSLVSRKWCVNNATKYVSGKFFLESFRHDCQFFPVRVRKTQ